MTKVRVQRVAEAIKEETSSIIRGLKDPRIGFLSIIRVEVSSDLRYAKIFVSVLGDHEAQVNTLSGLNRALGFIRSELGSRIRLRFTPEIVFQLDRSLEYDAKVAELLRQAKEDGPIEPSTGDGPDSRG